MRLITRSDFDGLGCAVLFKELGIIDSIKFVHPKDVQDGLISVSSNDILANIPYIKGCGYWFDHHSSEVERIEYGGFQGKSDPSAKSATHVVYDYYGGNEKFKNNIEAFVSAVDKADSADFSRDEILNPEGWVLLSFIMDPRTGLGRYKDYRISNYNLMMDMVDYCRNMTADEILEIPDVKERVDRYFLQDKLHKNMLLENSKVSKNVIVLDLRNVDEIFTGNRFLIYSLFPEQNISVEVIWGFKRQNTVLSCGHSIINRSSRTNVGKLMKQYGGGGHDAVGTCQVPNNKADEYLVEIIESIHKDEE
jgi:nanoRNase/pAp phosphatase (c-di-AMP/oligoRNAs hydrolase)